MSENDVYSVASFYGRFRFTSPEDGAAADGQAVAEAACDASVRPGEVRIALRNVGQINPEKIEEYKAREGYAGFAEALKMTSEEVVVEVGKSGLRGRGGAGFPTADKWRQCLTAPGDDKYLICDAAEGDPIPASAESFLRAIPTPCWRGW